MTPPRLLLASAIALVLAGCGAHAPGMGNASTPNADGSYRVLSDVSTASGGELLHLRPRGGVLSAERTTSGGTPTAGGVAIAQGERLYLALGPRAASVDLIVLQRVDAGVVGTWAYGARGGAGTEAWSGTVSDADPFVGTFETNGVDAESHEAYAGTVTVTREGDLYRVHWVTGEIVCEGTGFVDDDVLVVVGRGDPDTQGSPSFAAGDVGVAAYRREGTRYLGTFLLVRANGAYDRGSEELTPER
ncbi:MAG: hypothetical protein U0230_10870 [Polyangiales bacterium]